MHNLTKWTFAAATLITISCSGYKANNGFKEAASESERESNPANGEAGGKGSADGLAGGSDGKIDLEARVPTEAQKDAKTFLALTDEEALHGLKDGEDQIKIVCDRNAGKTNKFIKAFCVDKARPKSLAELQTALGLAFPANAAPGRGNNGAAGNGPAFAVQGHSSSLVGKFVSSINPRVILMDPTQTRDIVLGFVRGEQLSEIAVKNTDNTFDFFIVAFQQACNTSPEHCSPAHLLSPAVEKDWTAFTIYQDEDLKNSIVDCRHCHQPDGPGTQKILRMQELVNPWTHWFRDNTDGTQLIADYQAAHPLAETYGGIPGALIGGSDPAKLEQFVRNNGFVDANLRVTNNNPAQPNQFDTAGIRNQVAAQARVAATFFGGAACGVSATANSPSKSSTWDGLLFNFMNRTNACLLTNQVNNPAAVTVGKRNFIPPPYHGLKVTDPGKLATFTKQYQDLMAGTLPAKDFKDHRDIFTDDTKELSQVGFAVDPDMQAPEILKLACTQCHHSDLDPNISRSKFNAVDFSKMPNLNEELDIAISRIKLGYSPERLKTEGVRILSATGAPVEMHRGEHLLTMPPRRFRQLTDAQIDSLVKYFESKKSP